MTALPAVRSSSVGLPLNAHEDAGNQTQILKGSPPESGWRLPNKHEIKKRLRNPRH
jgi:hypothetical protein